MNRLSRLQQDFQHCLLAGNDEPVLSAITGTGRTAPKAQLAVYTNAYRLRLRDVLETDFPALAAALGYEAFDELADAYIEAHPSRGYSLRTFGARLPAFLRTQPGYKETPALAELATFEWTLGDAFDAADDPVVTVEDMTRIPPDHWPGLRFVFHAGVCRVDFAWNAPELWKAHKTESTPPEVQENSEPVAWVIWRQDFKVRCRSLEDHEPPLIDAARQAATFADMCELLTRAIPPEDVPLHAASTLKRWVNDGLISRVV
jgi:hypothetical protein